MKSCNLEEETINRLFEVERPCEMAAQSSLRVLRHIKLPQNFISQTYDRGSLTLSILNTVFAAESKNQVGGFAVEICQGRAYQ